MNFDDLRDFINILASKKQLIRIQEPIDPYLEITEICDRVLKQQGPALLFERPKHHHIPVLANLFGTPERVALGMGKENLQGLRELGELLAFLKAPTPPKKIKDLWEQWPLIQRMFASQPKLITNPLCQTIVKEGQAINLNDLPIQTCWPDDVAPLITWGMVITKNP